MTMDELLQGMDRIIQPISCKATRASFVARFLDPRLVSRAFDLSSGVELFIWGGGNQPPLYRMVSPIPSLSPAAFPAQLHNPRLEALSGGIRKRGLAKRTAMACVAQSLELGSLASNWRLLLKHKETASPEKNTVKLQMETGLLNLKLNP